MYLKRMISVNHVQFCSHDFPRQWHYCSSYRYNTVIGIGGNIGDVKRRFKHLLHFLQRDKKLKVYQTSSILKNPPFGYLDQPFFYNAVIIIKTNLQPHALLMHLHRVEKRFGRLRSFKDAPRTLDLDILFFDKREVKSKNLIIPHKEWYKRESVMIPLMEVSMGTLKTRRLPQSRVLGGTYT